MFLCWRLGAVYVGKIYVFMRLGDFWQAPNVIVINVVSFFKFEMNELKT